MFGAADKRNEEQIEYESIFYTLTYLFIQCSQLFASLGIIAGVVSCPDAWHILKKT